MTLTVRVIPKASRNLVKKQEDGIKVYVTKPAHDGLANRQVIALLAEYFKVKIYQVRIISGEKSRNKIVEVSGA